MRIVAIDPGSAKSAYVILDLYDGVRSIVEFGTDENTALLHWLVSINRVPQIPVDHLAIETITSRGIMPSEAVRTAIYVGRCIEAFSRGDESKYTEVRREVYRGHFCGSGGDDAAVKEAMKDRFGGAAAIGKVKCAACKGRGTIGLRKGRHSCSSCLHTPGWFLPPGPLAGMDLHEIQALAVGMFWFDTQKIQRE